MPPFVPGWPVVFGLAGAVVVPGVTGGATVTGGVAVSVAAPASTLGVSFGGVAGVRAGAGGRNDDPGPRRCRSAPARSAWRGGA